MATQASPFKTYKIRLHDRDTWHEATLTRNVWNTPWTGTFLAYDQDVAEATEVVALYCADCQDLPFKATRRDIERAEGYIECEHCGKPCIELPDNCAIYRRDGGLTLVENFVWGKRSEWLASLKPGEPCDHPGCLSHVTHPCEGCGRIAGRRVE